MEKQTEEYSSEFCVLPKYVNTENMFHGTQYYNTTEHLLGITENKESWVGHRIYNYNNPIFKGTIGYSSSAYYTSLVRYIKIGRKEYHSCNGLCDPKRSTQILDIYKAVQAVVGNEYITQYDVERYMLTEILKSNSK